MSSVNALISKRLQKTETNGTSKMAAMARQSATGNLTSFSGVFSVTELNDHEKDVIEAILRSYAEEGQAITQDLHFLITLTSEVKAINNQAALLHGERIKKAQEVLIRYKEGAFTTWLTTTYGNRQTPYNLLQYYEFHESLPKDLRPQVESMPRQAIYTLASREGSFEKKLRMIEAYQGETKAELLAQIRELFPLQESDGRKANQFEAIHASLSRVAARLQSKKSRFSKSQKTALLALLEELHTTIAE